MLYLGDWLWTFSATIWFPLKSDQSSQCYIADASFGAQRDKADDANAIIALGSLRSFFGEATLTDHDGTAAFVLDTGYSCTTPGSEPRHLPSNIIPTCYTPTNTVYYLVAAIDEAQNCDCESNCGSGGKGCLEIDFKVLPGVDTLDGIKWGKVTKEDIIIGWVRQLRSFLFHGIEVFWHIDIFGSLLT